MGAREFEVKQGAVLKIDALAGDRLRVRAGDVWITQHEDSKDYVLRTGQSMTLSGKGATLAMAYKPTLLDLYRKDPGTVRDGVVREAKRAQARALAAMLWRIFS